MADCSCGRGSCQPKSLTMPTISYQSSPATLLIFTAHDADALTDRVAVAEHVARKRFVHDQDAAGFEVERPEVTTGDH